MDLNSDLSLNDSGDGVHYFMMPNILNVQF